MDVDEILGSPIFYVLCAVGYAAFIFMLMILKGMDQQGIMPLWVKIVTAIIIPIAAALFAGYAEG
jgi:hypothetical protein